MPKRPHLPLLQRASILAEEVFCFSRREEIERDRGMRGKLGMCASAIEEELDTGRRCGRWNWGFTCDSQ